MHIGAILAITLALLAGSANAQAPAGSAEAASAPQAAPGKAATDQTTAAPSTRPSSTEKSQAAVTDSRLAPRSPNVPK
jgi:hypothetical protein